MTHKFDINTLTLSRPVQKHRLFYLLVKVTATGTQVSDTYWFRTAEQHMNLENTIAFMESNKFEVPADLMIYYSIALYEKVGNDSVLLQNKLLFKKDIVSSCTLLQKKESIGFVVDGDNNAVLHFKARVTKNAANLSLSPLEVQISEHAKELAETQDASKLQVLKMGGLMYRFVNKIDLLVYVNNYLREVANWKRPLHTIFFGSCLTFFILNPRLALMIVGAALLWYKDNIFVMCENYSKGTYHRLVPPEENLKFLQNQMTAFCDLYDNFKDMIYGEDTTQFIVLLNSIIAGAWVLLLLPIFVNFDTMMVILLWGALLMGNSVTRLVLDSLHNIHRNSFQHLIRKFENKTFMSGKFVTRVINQLERLFPGLVEVPVKKIFYVYEYQRWWLGNWGEPYRNQHKWSDESGKLSVLPRVNPPNGYQWSGQWRVMINLEETDEEGFQYSTSLFKSFHKEKLLLDTIRRRRWTRLCEKRKDPLE